MISLRSTKPAGRSPRRGARLPLTSYYHSQTDQAPSPFKQKPPRKNYRKYWFGAADVIVVIILVIGLVYSLSVSSSPQVEANDWSYHSKHDYQTAAQSALKSFKNRNKITFDETAVVKSLQQQFPEVQGAKVELPFFSQKPILHLSIAPPAFNLSSGGNSYVIDSAGVAVAQAINLPQIKDLPTVSDQSGFQVVAGKQVLSASAVGFISTLIAQCHQAKVPIASLALPPSSQTLDLRTKDQPYLVKFYLGGNAMVETGQFLAARHQFISNHQTPSQYLDVRVPGKTFYK